MKLPELFDTYNIDYCLIGYGDIEILDYLRAHPQWSLVFLDDNNCVYLKNVPKNKALIKKFEYKFLQPTTSSLYLERYLADAEKRSQVTSELKRWVESNPRSFRAHFMLGYWYSRLGKINQAIYNSNKAAKLYPQSPEIHNNLGIAYSQKGLYQEAIKEFKKAIYLDRNFSPAKENLKRVKSRFPQ